jgi:hypothetical protein
LTRKLDLTIQSKKESSIDLSGKKLLDRIIERGNFFIYLICHDFQKINGQIKIFDKCTYGVVPHSVRLLPPHPTALSPCRRGARRQESISCASVVSAAP